MSRQAEGCRKDFGGARLPAAHSRCLQLYARPGKALGQLGGHLLFLHACRSAAGQADASLRQLSWSRSASHPQTPCPALQSCGAAGTCPGRPAGRGHSRIGMDRRACGGMKAEMGLPSATGSNMGPPCPTLSPLTLAGTPVLPAGVPQCCLPHLVPGAPCLPLVLLGGAWVGRPLLAVQGLALEALPAAAAALAPLVLRRSLCQR